MECESCKSGIVPNFYRYRDCGSSHRGDGSRANQENLIPAHSADTIHIRMRKHGSLRIAVFIAAAAALVERIALGRACRRDDRLPVIVTQLCDRLCFCSLAHRAGICFLFLLRHRLQGLKSHRHPTYVRPSALGGSDMPSLFQPFLYRWKCALARSSRPGCPA